LAFTCRVDRERQVDALVTRVDGWELKPDLCRTTRAEGTNRVPSRGVAVFTFAFTVRGLHNQRALHPGLGSEPGGRRKAGRTLTPPRRTLAVGRAPS